MNKFRFGLLVISLLLLVFGLWGQVEVYQDVALLRQCHDQISEAKLTASRLGAELAEQTKELRVAQLQVAVSQGVIRMWTPVNMRTAVGWALMVVDSDHLVTQAEPLPAVKGDDSLSVMDDGFEGVAILFNGDPRAVRRLRLTCWKGGTQYVLTFRQLGPVGVARPAINQLRYVPVP